MLTSSQPLQSSPESKSGHERYMFFSRSRPARTLPRVGDWPVSSSIAGRASSFCKSRGRNLSYELLVSSEPIFGQGASRLVACAVILISGGIMLLPRHVLEGAWFPGALISINTLLVTGTIYLSGNASSELSAPIFCWP